jgi:triosephosphate isomerase
LHEDDAFVASKTAAALTSGIGVVLCCGESLEQREAGRTIEVVRTQLEAVAKLVKDWSNIVIAYEPIWAIGTGKVATTEQAQEVHEAIRKWLAEAIGQEAGDKTRVIYGGSVTDKNCRDLAKQKDIDGFLVGGASLKPACELSPFRDIAWGEGEWRFEGYIFADNMPQLLTLSIPICDIGVWERRCT